jgi:hypothetical protein
MDSDRNAMKETSKPRKEQKDNIRHKNIFTLTLNVSAKPSLIVA